MDYINLSDKAYRFLVALLKSEDPSDFTRKQFDNASGPYYQDLIIMIQELVKNDFITVNWYDNIPYYVQINRSAKMFVSDKNEKPKEEQRGVNTYNNTIVIGNNNNIHNSSVSIGKNYSSAADKTKESFYQRHPIICGFLISLIAGLVLLFSFWSYIIKFIEEFF